MLREGLRQVEWPVETRLYTLECDLKKKKKNQRTLLLSLMSSTHGLRGECCASPSPDLPDLHAVTFMAELDIS